MELLEDRPPYVSFDRIAIEDRDASLKQDRYITKDVEVACITPVGSKDRVIRPVTEWFAVKTKEVREGRFKAEWLRDYQGAFCAWKEGLELPPSGTPLRDWGALSPSQQNNLLQWNIRTVEDVATMNEEALQNVGHGSLTLKQRAIAWLDTIAKGASSAELFALRRQIEVMKEQNDLLLEQNKSLREQLPAQEPRSPTVEVEDDLARALRAAS